MYITKKNYYFYNKMTLDQKLQINKVKIKKKNNEQQQDI